MKRGKKLFTYLLVLVMLLANTVTGVAAELDEPLQEATQIVHEDGSGLLSEGGLLEAGDAVADSSYDHSHDAAIVAAMENLQDTIDVTGYGLTKTNVEDVIHGILNMNPQLFMYRVDFVIIWIAKVMLQNCSLHIIIRKPRLLL